MHITIVTPIFPPEIGGPATYVPELAKRLANQHQVTVVTFSKSKPTKFKEFIVEYASTGTNIFWRQCKLWTKILKQSKQTDVIYAQGTLTVGWQSLIVAKMLGKRLIVKYVGDEVWERDRYANQTTHDMESFYQQSLPKNGWLWLHRQVLNHAEVIVTPSEYLKQFLIKYHRIPAKQIRVVTNPVEVQIEPLSKPNHNKKLIFVGRLVGWKNVDQIIRLLPKLTGWSLIVIGSGAEEKRLKQLAIDLKVVVEFKGSQTHRQTQKLMSQADALVLLSDYEGQSHVLIEALLLRLPIIASDIPANQELIGSDGQLIPRNNPEKLVKAIKDIQLISVERNKQIVERYSWKNHLEQLGNIFEGA